MKELNQFELENVAGGIDPFTAAGIITVLTLSNAAWSFGKGFYKGYNS